MPLVVLGIVLGQVQLHNSRRQLHGWLMV